MKSLKIRKNLLRISHIIGILLVPRISAKQFFKQEPQERPYLASKLSSPTSCPLGTIPMKEKIIYF